MTTARWSLRLLTAVVVAVFVGGCTDRPVLPTVDVVADGRGTSAPAEGDVLVEGGWPEVAAFVTAAAEADEATVVNIFASWCEPCEDELPLLLQTSETTPDVRWIGVDSEDPLLDRDARPFVERLEVTWPTVFDPRGTTHIALEGRAMPTTAFFDRDGQLVDLVVGIVDEQRLIEALDRARG